MRIDATLAVSKGPAGLEVILTIIKVVENIHYRPLQKAKFEGLQVSHTSMLNPTE